MAKEINYGEEARRKLLLASEKYLNWGSWPNLFLECL